MNTQTSYYITGGVERIAHDYKRSTQIILPILKKCNGNKLVATQHAIAEVEKLMFKSCRSADQRNERINKR